MVVRPDFWKKRKVFITGHTGFKGSWLSLWLESLGAVVVGYSLAPPTTPSLYDLADLQDAVETIEGDVRNFDGLSTALAKCRPEIVIHMAAQSLVRRSFLEPLETYGTNVIGTANILQAVRLTDSVRCVLVVTSDKCYETPETSRPLIEEDRLGGEDPYSSSKACAEIVTAAFRRSFFGSALSRHVAIASVRAGNVFGGGDWAADRLIPDAMRSFAAGAPLPIRNPGSIRPWQHVLEPLHGYLLLLEKLFEDGAAYEGSWNFGPAANEEIPVRQIVECLIELWGEDASWYEKEADGVIESSHLMLDSSKSRNLLGWKPQWDLRTALTHTLQWYKAYYRGLNVRSITTQQIAEYRQFAEKYSNNSGLSTMRCRFCHSSLLQTFADLGTTPIANAFLTHEDRTKPEAFYPLRAFVCSECFLVQTLDVQGPETIFANYHYFSSYSETWLRHSEEYAEQMIQRLRLDTSSQVIEVGSNDGYLLQYFLRHSIPVLGIEPAGTVAAEARKKGIPTITEFFGKDLAERLSVAGVHADLLVANNVLAHVPDLNDFVAGLKILLSPAGTMTLEFPHLLRLIKGKQFDTIYHEHFSYFSFITAGRIFSAHKLVIFDVEELPTHGGSLRIYVGHAGNAAHRVAQRVSTLRQHEISEGLACVDTYTSFQKGIEESKQSVIEFLNSAKRAGKTVVAYGAAAKGNTLLNYCGLGSGFIEYAVDLNPHKQGLFLPGTHLPIYSPEKLRETKPDYVLVLPWNLRDEIIDQMSDIRGWGGQFVIPLPEIRIIP